MADPTHQSLDFPLRGLDRSSEYELQPTLTTPTALNVRGVEAATGRERGGSRPGLSRFIDQIPAGSASMIQDLNVVVTASVHGLLAHPDSYIGDPDEPDWRPPLEVIDTSTNHDVPPGTPPPEGPDYDPGEELDWRNPGPRLWPPGGGGWVPDPFVGPEEEGGGGDPEGWRFEQKKFATLGTSIVEGGAPVTAGVELPGTTEQHQLLVCVWVMNTNYFVTNPKNTNTPAWELVGDSLGNSWTTHERFKVDLSATPGVVDNTMEMGMASCRNSSGGTAEVFMRCSNTNTSDPEFGAMQSIGTVLVLEYRGLETSTPFEGSVEAADGNPSGAETVTAGPIPVGGQTRLALAVSSAPHAASVTPPAGWTQRQGTIYLLEILSSDVAEEASIAAQYAESPNALAGWGQIAASWRYQ